MLTFLLLLAAAICFFVAVLIPRIGEISKVNFVALGLFFWVLVPLIAAVPK